MCRECSVGHVKQLVWYTPYHVLESHGKTPEMFCTTLIISFSVCVSLCFFLPLLPFLPLFLPYYSLRSRCHDRQLIPKRSKLYDTNFVNHSNILYNYVVLHFFSTYTLGSLIANTNKQIRTNEHERITLSLIFMRDAYA